MTWIAKLAILAVEQECQGKRETRSDKCCARFGHIKETGTFQNTYQIYINKSANLQLANIPKVETLYKVALHVQAGELLKQFQRCHASDPDTDLWCTTQCKVSAEKKLNRSLPLNYHWPCIFRPQWGFF